MSSKGSTNNINLTLKFFPQNYKLSEGKTFPWCWWIAQRIGQLRHRGLLINSWVRERGWRRGGQTSSTTWTSSTSGVRRSTSRGGSSPTLWGTMEVSGCLRSLAEDAPEYLVLTSRPGWWRIIPNLRPCLTTCSNCQEFSRTTNGQFSGKQNNCKLSSLTKYF